jgi:prepilin-type N-terminal cleavage/methylation domain-containing protein
MWRTKLAAESRHDDGFTLIEIIVAMFLTLILMTVVLAVLVSGLQTISLARQRQTATSLTTQSMERLRALDYASVTVDNPAAWPMDAGLSYVSGGAPPLFAPSSVLPGVSEPLLVNNYSGKRVSSPIDGVNYVVQTYVTDPVPSAGQQQVYNLTVITSWSSSVSHGQRNVAQRSVLFSPSGCLTAADHPFSGPCQSAFVAHAGQSLGGFTVSADSSTGNIDGFDGRMISLALPVLSSDLTMEQTASAKGLVGTIEGRSTGATDAIAGGVGASVAVTSDPSSASPQTKTSTAMQSSGEVSLSGALGQLVAHAPTGTSGTSSAAIYADLTLCRNGTAAGLGLVTGPVGALRPCVSSSVDTNASSGFIALRAPTAVGSVDALLVSLGTGAAVSRAVAANLASAMSGTACDASTPAIATGGCVHAAVTRSLGTVSVLDPTGSLAPPAGYQGLWYVDGLTETASSESGRGARNPTYTKSGTLHWWNGLTYVVVPLNGFGSAGSPADITLPSVTLTYPDGLTVTASGAVTVNHPTSVLQGASACTATCPAGVDGSSTVRSILTFQVTKGASTSTFGMAADLGGLIANSSFKAAPIG